MSIEGDASGHWSISDIPYGSIVRDRARSDPYLLYLVAGASFIEITSDLFSGSLLAYFEGDRPLQRWLAERWEREETQHGEALRRYVDTVWPEFDWETAYSRFREEYAPLCAVNRLGPTRALELASRCVVETGTSTFYTMLAQAAPEPVLRELAARIAHDELRHYNLFHYHYRRLAAKEGTSRPNVLNVLWSRVREVEREDAYYAFKHIFRARHPNLPFTNAAYDDFRRHYIPLAHRHYPYRRAARMFVQPLRIHPFLQSATIPVLALGTWMFLL